MYVYRSPADLYNVSLETKTFSLQEVQDITKKILSNLAQFQSETIGLLLNTIDNEVSILARLTSYESLLTWQEKGIFCLH